MSKFETPKVIEVNGFSESVFMASGKGELSPGSQTDVRAYYVLKVTESGPFRFEIPIISGKVTSVERFNGTATVLTNSIILEGNAKVNTPPGYTTFQFYVAGEDKPRLQEGEFISKV